MSVRSNRIGSRACWALAFALVCLGAGPAAAEGPILGRLFMAPKERAELDKVRYAEPEPPPEPVTEAPEIAEAKPPPRKTLDPFSMDGLVVRHSGPNTAWVDGSAVIRHSRTRQGIDVDPSSADAGGMTVELPGQGGVVTVKPGQAFDPRRNRVTDVMVDGERDRGADTNPAWQSSRASSPE